MTLVAINEQAQTNKPTLPYSSGRRPAISQSVSRIYMNSCIFLGQRSPTVPTPTTAPLMDIPSVKTGQQISIGL